MNITELEGWRLVAVVVDRSSGRAELYWNGKRVAADQTILTNFINSNRMLRIGSTLNNQRFFKGKVDNVRLYGVALTLVEVATLANQ